MHIFVIFTSSVCAKTDATSRDIERILAPDQDPRELVIFTGDREVYLFRVAVVVIIYLF